jgi:hypothetical protein
MAIGKRFFTAVVLLTTVSWLPIYAADHSDVLQQIERMTSLGEKADPSLEESIADGIEKNSTQISKALITKLKDNKLTEQQQSVYLWALGLTKDQAAVNAIETLHEQSKSEGIQAMCLRALASIGGRQAGNFLLSALNKTTDEDQRFNILNLLGQMQYEPALPDQFWKEKDVELRLIILSSLEATISDLSQMKVFFEQVAVKEKDKQVLEFARETLDMMNEIVSPRDWEGGRRHAYRSHRRRGRRAFTDPFGCTCRPTT